MSVYIHLAEGFEEIEAVTPVDVLRRAGIDARLVSVGDDRAVKGAHGITIEADLLFSQADYEGCRMIVLPGGLQGALNLQKHKGLESRILEFAARGKWLAAICAAPMIYGDLGLLEGRRAVSYPGMTSRLRGAVVSDEKVVVDGNFITSKGPGTAFAFALALVKALCGEKEAAELAEKMLLDCGEL